MTLADYTIEELKAEIKRRKALEKPKEKMAKPKKEYAELVGEVTYVSFPCRGNKVKEYSFKVRFKDEELFSFPRVQKYQNNYEYYKLDKNFKKVEDIPLVGDMVVVRSCITNFFRPFIGTNWDEENVIVKVIRRKDYEQRREGGSLTKK